MRPSTRVDPSVRVTESAASQSAGDRKRATGRLSAATRLDDPLQDPPANRTRRGSGPIALIASGPARRAMTDSLHAGDVRFKGLRGWTTNELIVPATGSIR